MRKNLLLLIVSSALAFLLAEGIARLFFPQWAPRTARLTQFWRFDPVYGWSHVPGSAGLFELFGTRYKVTINARGFRGPLVRYERNPHRKRIVVLGDSYVWGYGVNDEETFTALLANMRPGLEVINLGVSGYSTDQELLLYLNEGYKYNSDLVVLLFSMNDFAGNIARVQFHAYGKPLFVLRDGQLHLENQPVQPVAWWRRALTGIAGRSYLLNTANRLVADIRVSRNPALKGPATTQARAKTFPLSPAEQVTARLLVEFKQAVARKQPQAHFLVLLHDDMGVMNAQLMCRYLEGVGIDCLRLSDYLRHEDQSLHLADGNHWNAAGNQVVAKTLAAHLQSRR